MDRSEGERRASTRPKTSPSRREAARCEQAKRDNAERLSRREQVKRDNAERLKGSCGGRLSVRKGGWHQKKADAMSSNSAPRMTQEENLSCLNFLNA